jgi:hypothetical protein
MNLTRKGIDFQVKKVYSKFKIHKRMRKWM